MKINNFTCICIWISKLQAASSPCQLSSNKARLLMLKTTSEWHDKKQKVFGGVRPTAVRCAACSGKESPLLRDGKYIETSESKQGQISNMEVQAEHARLAPRALLPNDATQALLKRQLITPVQPLPLAQITYSLVANTP